MTVDVDAMADGGQARRVRSGAGWEELMAASGRWDGPQASFRQSRGVPVKTFQSWRRRRGLRRDWRPRRARRPRHQPSRGEPRWRALACVRQPAADDGQDTRLRARGLFHPGQAAGAGPVRVAGHAGAQVCTAVADRAAGAPGRDRHHRPAPPHALSGGVGRPARRGPPHVGGHRAGGEQRPAPPRRQPADPVGRMGVDGRQDVGQPDAGVDALHPAGGGQPVDGPHVLRSVQRPGEEPAALAGPHRRRRVPAEVRVRRHVGVPGNVPGAAHRSVGWAIALRTGCRGAVAGSPASGGASPGTRRPPPATGSAAPPAARPVSGP